MYEDQQKVWYKMFYNDYDYLDNNGLGAKVYGLTKTIFDEEES